MRLGGIGMSALAAAGLMATGAAAAAAGTGGPPMPVAPLIHDGLAHARSDMARALSTPRLYKVTRSGGASGGLGVSTGAVEMCVDAEVFDRLTQGVEAPAVGAPVEVNRKGCKLSYVRRAGGGFHMDNACDKAAGAPRTWHSVVDGTVKDMRSSLEMAVDDPRSGDTRIVSMDMHMVDAGACPADLAPGQMRTADGRILDPSAARAAGAARAARPAAAH
ncbi:hypothetical protein [Phenylobacterium sp.]|uniref:hypothetical protein n=1 Tax=Phenylobacterium sp. TaxID=1871053 RepID=UPI002CA2CCD2|nr:hypothetical protein [Phenylobacterium sp.]HLZ76010.1 hypothetical protein [Phenylobacterium sp.]